MAATGLEPRTPRFTVEVTLYITVVQILNQNLEKSLKE